MSTSSASIKPVFSTAEEEPLLNKPVSKLAILSMILGMVGVLSPITGALLPVPLAAAVLGLVGSYQLSRQSCTQSGAWMANVGLFMGLLCFSWSGISTKADRDNLAKNGAEFASYFLKTLAEGKIYVAAELQQPFAGRQVAGLDLKSYYEAYDDSKDPQLEGDGGEPNDKLLAKKKVVDLRKHPVSTYVRGYPNANWVLYRIEEIAYKQQNTQSVVVILVNSEDSSGRIAVSLERQKLEESGRTVADWHVKDMRLL
jgi:hypothetical protein